MKGSYFSVSVLRILGLATILTCSFSLASAQCGGAEYAANEVGTRIAGITDASSLGGKTFSNRSSHFGFLNGIHYKRYFYTTALRLSFAYTRYDEEIIENCIDCTAREEGTMKAGQFRAGYEYIFILNRFEPYLALDAVVLNGRYEGTEQDVGLFIDDDREKWGLGISPVAGMRYFFAYSVSISAEMSLDMMLTQTKIQRIQTLPDPGTANEIVNSSETMFNPAANVSVNVLF